MWNVLEKWLYQHVQKEVEDDAATKNDGSNQVIQHPFGGHMHVREPPKVGSPCITCSEGRVRLEHAVVEEKCVSVVDHSS